LSAGAPAMLSICHIRLLNSCFNWHLEDNDAFLNVRWKEFLLPLSVCLDELENAMSGMKPYVSLKYIVRASISMWCVRGVMMAIWIDFFIKTA
jgi:hypothetical protein